MMKRRNDREALSLNPGQTAGHRRAFRGRTLALAAALLLAITGCRPRETGPAAKLGEVDHIWGRRGQGDGRLQKPRAIAIDDRDELYIIDMLARIQVFDTEGKLLRGWTTPSSENGRPTGVSIARDGRVLVPDTHYFRVLIYSREGKLEQVIGGTFGSAPGEFGFVTDVAEDADGNLYTSEYGRNDRIQKFDRDGNFLLQWGTHGDGPGQFNRPQSIGLDHEGNLWVVDACNHRVQIFSPDGKYLREFGTSGSEPGQLYYPYGLAFDREHNAYLCEYGNHRIQKFSPAGEPLGLWGSEGRGPSQLFNPWGVAFDSKGRMHVLDSNNHRVQRVVLD